MFLRSLSLRGFKSFADRTLLDVEPGITVIVGPNGSGKSNVVDALAWVLGTHSAKKVRGQAMSDVIFAGSPERSRAGQARVEIVVDNSDGALSGGVGTAASASEFAEVRIARVVHHDGEAAYEINGEEVRALDVQELLSDSGLGRELHTIVGQGQLDEILNARPEERRRYIEEAAGILKHRRRRERALRKLEQVDGHIDKLKTVLRELRRQLKPLERQAEAADRHRALQADLREIQASVAACELAEVVAQLASHDRGDADVRGRLDDVEQRLADVRTRREQFETEAAELEGSVEQASTARHRLASLLERVRGTADLVDARRRHLVEYVEEPLAGRPPADLRAQAAALDDERDERDRLRVADEERLDAAVQARRDAEAARREHEHALQAERRRRAEQRERVLRWEGEISALRGAIASAEAELGRVSSSLISLDTRIEEAEREAAGVQEEIQALDVREVELTAALEDAEGAVTQREAVVEALHERIRRVEAEQSAQRARAEALRAAAEESDAGTRALLDSGLAGVIGRVADHVRVDASATGAVAAALGWLGEAVVTRNANEARLAVAWLRDAGSGSATVLHVDANDPGVAELDDARRDHIARAGARPLTQLMEPASSPASADVVRTLGRWLAMSFLVESWDEAVRLHAEHPRATFVTPAGDVAGPFGYRASGSVEQSTVAAASAADVADERATQLQSELDGLRDELAAADEALGSARRDLAFATERINESDARITGAAERLARLNKEIHALANQREVVAAQRDEIDQVLARDREALAQLHGRGPDDDTEDDTDERVDDVAASLDERVESAREDELQARVRLERAAEQVRHLELRAQALRDEADEVEASLADAARRREQRRIGIDRCGALAVIVRETVEALERALVEADEQRTQRAAALDDHRSRHGEAREHEEALAAERDALREQRHSSQLSRAQASSRRDAIEQRVRSELSLSADELLAEHPDARSYDRDDLVAKEDELVRRIGLLGRVNPLALEEFKALEERHAFLSDQLDDLRRSRRDLQEVVTAVDERIRQVFREAFDDVAREFELTFSTVFPGGHGRLVMTGTDDLLTAGVDVEARPPGKRVTRLSLLSGGERSLTVLAFVFAIFRARPSPFYVLDEVDAALDDVNLQRLLRVIRSFRGNAQVIVVTHQKRTMEIADLLYGVTMGPDGVTKVVAERLEDSPAAGAALDARTSDAPTSVLAPDADDAASSGGDAA